MIERFQLTELLPVEAARHFVRPMGAESLHVIVSRDNTIEEGRLWHYSVSVKKFPADYARWATFEECAAVLKWLFEWKIIPKSAGQFERIDSREVPVRQYFEIAKR